MKELNVLTNFINSLLLMQVARTQTDLKRQCFKKKYKTKPASEETFL